MAPYTINENIYTHGSGLEPDGPFSGGLYAFFTWKTTLKNYVGGFLFTFHKKMAFGLHLTNVTVV